MNKIIEQRRDKIIKYRSQGRTLQEIGELFNLTRERVRQILLPPKLSKREIRKLSLRGKTCGSCGAQTLNRKYCDKCSPYKKGLGGLDYIRETIRMHYKYTCQKCGKVWQENERRFDVHHLSCDSRDTKGYDKNWSKETVTLLCHKCHLNIPEHISAMQKTLDK